MQYIEKKLEIENTDLVSLLGINDSLLSLIENRFHASILFRGNTLNLKGTEAEITAIESVFKELHYMIKKNKILQQEEDKENKKPLDKKSPPKKPKQQPQPQNEY